LLVFGEQEALQPPLAGAGKGGSGALMARAGSGD
jgi:hypothetical protein